jgi:hypothetical protein
MVHGLEGNLEEPWLGLSPLITPLMHRVTHVVHAAASVKFDIAAERAARRTSRRAQHVELAHVAAAARFVYVSTAYATPHPGATFHRRARSLRCRFPRPNCTPTHVEARRADADVGAQRTSKQPRSRRASPSICSSSGVATRRPRFSGRAS